MFENEQLKRENDNYKAIKKELEEEVAKLERTEQIMMENSQTVSQEMELLRKLLKESKTSNHKEHIKTTLIQWLNNYSIGY